MKLILQRFLYTFCVACRPHKSRTVRYAFPLVLVSLLFLSANVLLSEPASYLLLDPSTRTIREGEPLSLDVYIFAHEPVNAIDISVAYPESQIEVKNIDAGSSVITLWTQDPYIEDNTVYLSGGTYGEGFVGEHFIARIDAVAKKSGIANIAAENIRLLAGDGAGTEVDISESFGQETVQIQIANEAGQITGAINVIKIVTDIDGDGEVDLRDISIFMSAWRTRDIIYDFNGDGRMTFRDFGIILADSFFK